MTLAETIEKMVDSKVKKALDTGTRTVPAEYVGKDAQGKEWVTLPGAGFATPVRRSAVEAAPGDTVSVTIGGGIAVIDANISNPSAGMKGVAAVEQKATASMQTAEKAVDYAGQASAAASNAQESANAALVDAQDARAGMQTAMDAASRALAEATAAIRSAQIADEKAEAAAESATEAQASADYAQSSAIDAQVLANTAGRNLSDVERVVGTLNWISEHSEYATAEGTIFDPERVYYTRSNETYALTSDTELVAGKTYYTRTGSGTEADPYVYTAVEEPDVSDIGTYYEVTNAKYTVVPNPVEADLASYYYLIVNDSIQNYIASHVALTDDGLWLLADENAYRALLASVGLEIRNPSGKSVALYGENFRIGAADEVHLLGTSTRLAFHSSAGDIAYFGMDDNGIWQMFIQQASVTNMIRFGNYAWVKRKNGHMTIKYLED